MSRGIYVTSQYTGEFPTPEAAFHIFPDKLHRDGSKGGVISLHGAGSGGFAQGGSAGATGNINIAISDQCLIPMVSIDAGADGTAARIDNYGNPCALNAVTSCRTWAQTAASGYYDGLHPAFTSGKIGLIGYSMGAELAHNYAARNPANVAFLILIAPAIDLDYVYVNVTARDAAIDNAFGGILPGNCTATGTGSTTWSYQQVWNYADYDGIPSTGTATNTGAAQASLAGTPNTVTIPAFTNLNNPMGGGTGGNGRLRGVKLLRQTGGAGAYALIDTIGCGVTSALTGVSPITTISVNALPFGIANGTVMKLTTPDMVTTQNVTLTVAAAASAVSLTVTSFTPTVNYPVGSTLVPVTYSDKITTAGSAYTKITTPWTTNGKHANDGTTACFNPTGYCPAGAFQSIPKQIWWSNGDTTTGTPLGVGTPPLTMTTYQTNAGGSSVVTLNEITGDPVHGQAAGTLGANAANLATLLSFAFTNKP